MMLVNSGSTALPSSRLALISKQPKKSKLQVRAQTSTNKGSSSNVLLKRTREACWPDAKGCRLSHRQKHVISVQNSSSELESGPTGVAKDDPVLEVEEVTSLPPAEVEGSSPAEVRPLESSDAANPAGTSGQAETQFSEPASPGKPGAVLVDAPLVIFGAWLTRVVMAARDALLKFWGIFRKVKLKKLQVISLLKILSTFCKDQITLTRARSPALIGFEKTHFFADRMTQIVLSDTASKPDHAWMDLCLDLENTVIHNK